MAIQTAQWAATRTRQPDATEATMAGDGTPASYHIWTIGCQMNKADSDRLASALDQLGLRPAPTAQHADVVVFNSCVVRQSAEDKVVGALGMAKALKRRRPERIVALMGCMVGPKKDALEARFGHVDVFMQPQQYAPLLELVGERLGVDYEGCIGPLTDAHADVTSYIPIIQGCDLFCSFCIIPYRPRPAGEPPAARRGARGRTARGARRPRGHAARPDGGRLRPRPSPAAEDLADLLHALNGVGGLERVRFLTSHPMYMSDRIIEAVADLPKVCEHINLPVQAGDDAVLSAMRRTYSADEYLATIERIRAAVPGVALSTDLIVGFCGESEEAFQASYRLLEAVRFDKVHVAQYSTREGTIAHRTLTDDVPRGGEAPPPRGRRRAAGAGGGRRSTPACWARPSRCSSRAATRASGAGGRARTSWCSFRTRGTSTGSWPASA